MQLSRLFTKLNHFKNSLKGKCHYSYSQSGEDLVVSYLFRSLKIQMPTYLEIGSNHPFIDNNTYLFYCKGSTGVCVEPAPALFKEIKRFRPNDIVINAGIGTTGQEADFYSFPHPYTGWNTFSKEEAVIREQQGQVKIQSVKKIKLLNINEVIEANFEKAPDFLSIDVEGFDLPILKSLDFEKYGPLVICAETVAFSVLNTQSKADDLIEYVNSKGYFVYADTHINSIFCRKDIFNRGK